MCYKVVCHGLGLRLKKQDALFRVTFEHFWSQYQFLRHAAGALLKVGLSLKPNYYNKFSQVSLPKHTLNEHTVFQVNVIFNEIGASQKCLFGSKGVDFLICKTVRHELEPKSNILNDNIFTSKIFD